MNNNDDDDVSKDRRKENRFANTCLTKIKEHLTELNDKYVIIQERQGNIITIISENKSDIRALEKEIQSVVGKCPFEADIRCMINQCSVCRGSKTTWGSMPNIVMLIISFTTLILLLLRKNIGF